MGRLASELRLEQADEIYALLIEAHRGLTAEASQKLNARLILLLLNQVGDTQIVREAIRAARPAADDPNG